MAVPLNLPGRTSRAWAACTNPSRLVNSFQQRAPGHIDRGALLLRLCRCVCSARCSCRGRRCRLRSGRLLLGGRLAFSFLFTPFALRCATSPGSSMPPPHKNIRLHVSKYIGQSSYFITLCCAFRRPVFANSENASWLIANLCTQSALYRICVRAYCVMPDHFHGLFSGIDLSSDLLAFIKTSSIKPRANIYTDFNSRCGKRNFTITFSGNATILHAWPDIFG